MNSKLLLSIPEAANALSVCRGTVYNLFERGALKRVKVGTATRITVASLQAYVASLEVGAAVAEAA